MAKTKNNRQVLIAAVKGLSDFEVAILRERLLSSVDFVLNNEAGLKNQMANSFISAELFIESCRAIKRAVDFEEPGV